MNDFEKHFNGAIKFLSFRPRSEKEMRDFLKRKKTPDDILEKIITVLKEKKFLNDKDFTRLWVSQRTTLRPKSKGVIKMELLQKGIDPEIIDAALTGEDGDGVSDLDQATKLVMSRLSRYKSFPKQEIYQKLGGFLARRGFRWETIKKAIDTALLEE
jgi:regulatory protein